MFRLIGPVCDFRAACHADVNMQVNFDLAMFILEAEISFLRICVAGGASNEWGQL
jgi:hypothetical protein